MPGAASKRRHDRHLAPQVWFDPGAAASVPPREGPCGVGGFKNFVTCLKGAFSADAVARPLKIWFRKKPASDKKARCYVWALKGFVRSWCRTIAMIPHIFSARSVRPRMSAQRSLHRLQSRVLSPFRRKLFPGLSRRHRRVDWGWRGQASHRRRARSSNNIVRPLLLPYVPELNLMKSVRDYFCTRKLSGCVWDNYDAIVKVCANVWRWFIGEPDRIRSIRTGEWATVNV